MATGTAVWGIDIGQCALKAVKLRHADDGRVEAVAFDVIEHPKILSQPDADRDELIHGALEKFASRNDWQKDQFVIGIPGQQTFARFCKMPPIDLKKDSKKIKDLVKYEASQQIPFDMEDVVWDYQVFASPDSPDVEVGIFAIRKDLIRKQLEYFAKVGIVPTGVQTIPCALYNFAQYDQPVEGGATVLIDVGAQNTDLIIVEPNSAWTRNIPLGGNSFTEALVRSFKLSFAKAEQLKRTAASSKYARQIFQAMRPIFAELVAEIQRSIGFYSSTHRETELKRVVALGSAFRLPGLQKYLENNLTIPGGVAKLEKFAQLVPSATINAPQFTENILSFGAAYGLALQGLGLAKISASLLPSELARVAVWRKKKPYFVAAAACLGVGALMPYTFNSMAKSALGSTDSSRTVSAIVEEAKGYRDRYNQAKTDTGGKEKDFEQLRKINETRPLVMRVYAAAYEALPPVDAKLAEVRTADDLRKLIANNPKLERTERGQFFIESLSISFVADVDAAEIGTSTEAGSSPYGTPSGPGSGAPMTIGRPGGGGGRSIGRGAPTPQAPSESESSDAGSTASAGKPGFVVQVKGRLLYGKTQAQASDWLLGRYYPRLQELGLREGMGFYMPDAETIAKDKAKDYVSEKPTIMRHPDAGAGTPGGTPAAPQGGRAGMGRGGSLTPGGVPVVPGTPEVTKAGLDPVTGEDMRDDWRLEFGFKVRIGEPPKPDAKPAGGDKKTGGDKKK